MVRMGGLMCRYPFVGALVLAVAVGWGGLAQASPGLVDQGQSVRVSLASLEAQFDAIIGLYAVDEQTGRTLSYRDGESFAMASTFKTYAAARVLQKAERGELSLQDSVYIEPSELVDYSPVTAPHAGASMTLAQLAAAALQHSDNTAANLLLKTIGGPSAITEFARSIGDDRTRLDRWEPELNSAIPGDPRDTSTPRALGTGYRSLISGDILGPPQRQQLKDWMLGNVTSASSMRAGLPAGWTSADKTGSAGYGTTNDIGIAYGPNGRSVLLAVMTTSQSPNPEADNMRALIAKVSAQALAGFSGPA